MILNSRLLSSAAVFAVTCAISAAAYYYKSRNTEINEVMVFCKLQYNAYNYFDKLISFIEGAKESVNVCMPGIHNIAIQGRLVKLLKSKGIKARIIIDRSGYNESTEVFIKELIDAGAEVKCNVKGPVHKMQHKFCLIDDKILMTGTLNWGNDRSSDHWNYVYITSKPQLVTPVKREFYQMWEEFSSEIGPLSDSQGASSESDAEIEIVNNLTDEDQSYTDAQTLRETDVTPELCLL